jgi:hypothetical protein
VIFPARLVTPAFDCGFFAKGFLSGLAADHFDVVRRRRARS